jgi:hypothetical protein
VKRILKKHKVAIQNEIVIPSGEGTAPLRMAQNYSRGCGLTNTNTRMVVGWKGTTCSLPKPVDRLKTKTASSSNAKKQRSSAKASAIKTPRVKRQISEPGPSVALSEGAPCRFAHDGCAVVLKNKASEASHACSNCKFRRDDSGDRRILPVPPSHRPQPAARAVRQCGPFTEGQRCAPRPSLFSNQFNFKSCMMD